MLLRAYPGSARQGASTQADAASQPLRTLVRAIYCSRFVK